MKHANRPIVVALIVAFVALFGAAFALILGWAANDARIRDIQESRLENQLTTCLAANRQSRAIVRFVSRVGPELRPVVVVAFPLVPNCERYARERTR